MSTVLSYLSPPLLSDADRPGMIENGPLLAPGDGGASSSSAPSSSAAAARAMHPTAAAMVSGSRPSGSGNGKGDVGESESNEAERQARRAKWVQKEEARRAAASGEKPRRRRRPRLRSSVVHDADYVLVGENVWTILSSKFGYDRSVVAELRVQKGWHARHKLFVEVPMEMCGDDGNNGRSNGDYVRLKSIEVPESGRWNYGTLDDTCRTENVTADSAVAANAISNANANANANASAITNAADASKDGGSGVAGANAQDGDAMEATYSGDTVRRVTGEKTFPIHAYF